MTDSGPRRNAPGGAEDEKHENKRLSADEPCPTPGKTRMTRGSTKTGEGSFRGLLSGLSRTTDRSTAGPPMGEMDRAYYLREEMHAARHAVRQLDTAVQEAVSFREAASKLREEAHRAMGRLEKAVDYTNVDPDLIDVACDIKCAAKRGITLVDVYGKYNTVVKIMTLFLRSYIHAKFEKQTEQLRRLIPSVRVPPQPQVPLPAMPAASQPLTAVTGGSSAHPTAGGGGGSIQSTTSGPSGSAMQPGGQPDAPAQPAPGAGGVQNSLGRTSVGALPPAASPAPAAAGALGKLLQSNRHEKVIALAYVPAVLVQPSEYVCIWWSAGQSLEFYNEATQSTTAFQQPFNVTALGVDDVGTVWMGHAKGQVRVMPKAQWERTVEERPFTGSVKAIAFDETGRAWLGDESGRIKVLSYDPRVGKLETVASLSRSPGLAKKGGLFGKRHCTINNSGTSGQPSAAVVFAAASVAANTMAAAANTMAAAANTMANAVIAARDGSPGGPAATAAGGHANGGAGGSSHYTQGATDGPVRCIFVRGNHAWTSGGRTLQLWDSKSFQDLDVYECGTFGACYSMAALRWPSSTAGPSYHPAAGGPPRHRHTNSDGSLAPPPLPPSTGSGGYPWRLLTGHENGQLLLWHPEHRTLAPLLRIGEPCSPVRGIAVFEAYNLVVTGHGQGCLRLFRQPAADGSLPPGSDSAAPQSLGLHRPKMATVVAHKSRLERMTFGTSSCVTVSMLNTIRMWHAADLAQEAQRQNVTLTHASPSYGCLLGADFSPPGSSHYNAGSTHAAQYQRDSARGLGGEPSVQTAGSQLVTPTGQVPTAAALLGAGSGLSSNASGMLLATFGTGTPLPPGLAPGAAAGGGRGSKDSLDTAAGTQTQPSTAQSSSSTATTTNTVPLTGETVGGFSTTTAPSVSGASFAHFQTIEYSELRPIKIIGSGAYGEVLLADWTGSEVAVKKLFAVHNMDDKESGALLREVTLLGSLSHPNVVRFLAVCVDPPCIVMQYYPHGSLFDLLRRAQKGNTKADKELTWSKRLDMLRDVAAGMQYLHSRKPPVIHGDLRSPNLLLDLTIDRERPRFHVKIADFGLARMATNNTGSVMVSKTTNPRWLAPEVIQKSSVGKAADVYSFSIIMWEMLTWKQPYQDMMSVQVMFSTVNDGSRPDVPPDGELPGAPGVSLQMYLQLMESCWQADAAARPSFKEIVDMLADMLRVEAEATRQLRQQQQMQMQNQAAGLPPPPTPPPQQALHAGSPGGVGDHAAPAGPTGTVSAPGSGGSGAGVVSPAAAAAAAAAVAAAARRAASASGVASPFLATSLGSPGEHHGDNGGGGGGQDSGGMMSYQQSHGSVLPLYGMSPILEETASASTNAAPAMSGPGTAAAVAMATSSPPQPPHPQHHNQHHHYHHHHHQGLSQPHPHVHFAPSPSPFSQQPAASVGATPPGPGPGLGSGPASSSCPASPAVGTRTSRLAGAATAPYPSVKAAPGAAGSSTHPPSSASSSESGAAHAVSGGTIIAGAPSTASSSRQSSTSTSGRALGAAAAAAVAAAAAAAAGGGGGRKAAAQTGAAAATAGTASRADVSASAATRLDGSAAAAASSQPDGDGAVVAASDRLGSDAMGLATAPTAQLTEAESISAPVAHALSCLSPFASMPAAQLGELDAAVPQLAPAAPTTVAGGTHFRAAASPSPKILGTPRGAGGGGGGAGAHAVHGRGTPSAGRPGSVGNIQPTAAVTAAAAATSGARSGRIPVASGGHAPTAARSGTGTPSGTPRTPGVGSGSHHHTNTYTHTHSQSHSQPGTPPYRGAAGPSSVGRGQGVGVATSGSGARPGTTATTGAAGAASRSHSGGDGPSSGGNRRPGGDSMPRTVAVSAHAAEAAAAASVLATARTSYSAAHAHLDSHDEHGSSRPGHRRTPSGGSVGSHPSGAGLTQGPGGATRARDLWAGGPPHPHGHETHPRTPTHLHAARGVTASPRLSAPNASSQSSGTAGDPRVTSGARRHLAGHGAAAGGGGMEVAGSPSAPSSGHLSRLAAAVIASSTARPPGSPRSYIPGGPGATSAPGNGGGGGGGGGVSRIPSITQGTPPQAAGSSAKPVQVAKSSTSRSLDDGNLRRLGLTGNEASASPPVDSAAVSPPDGGAASGAVADTAWEDGLDGGEHQSPDVTREVEDGADRASVGLITRGGAGGAAAAAAAAAGQDTSVAHHPGAGSADGVCLPYGRLPRIATLERKAASASASAVWQPPPLLAATAGGVGSPFAAAAYASPFFPGDEDADACGDETPAEAEAGATGTVESTVPNAMGSSGVVVATTSPTVSEAEKIRAAWSTGSSGPPRATEGSAAAAPAPTGLVHVTAAAAAAPQSPFATAAATTTPSPFAQAANDHDSWWDEQQHHHDD